ncbi:hypothetical protein BUM88_18575 [Acinetobacter calcoaceticus]|jgi:hypothetical protein|uniref:hypothetical protein n=1 Tax=Acinetobacter calcoaceticus TaxID=471 RepID=UPI0009AE4A63|nr:hypothetical protein [Acinetobacter calcoaceticus]AQZ83441.1 hypothetical protein BUM88_18575 [Acinetobacter calcoaceticus]
MLFKKIFNIKTSNTRSKKQSSIEFLSLQASENILGKPGYRELEGGTWACYNQSLGPGPALPSDVACR